jgi:dipeptidyl aminopeptidase/acylaminoacyl peptidase
VLIPDAVDAAYAGETGHLMYADASGGVWAVPFEPDEGTLAGEPTPVLAGVTVSFGRFARFALSRNGTLVHGAGGATGGGTGAQQLLVTDLEGNEDVRPLEPRQFRGFRWSPDGASVTFFSDPGPDINVYTYNVELGTTPRQLTFEGMNVEPVWSPDGTRVAFASARDGTDGMDLFVKAVDDDAPPELILSRPGVQLALHWPAEDMLVFEDGSPSDLWIVDPSDSSSALPYLTSESELEDVAISPDLALAAYTSDETGVEEVYVRSFPTPRQPVRVSDGGGDYPRWSPDGDVLYYWRNAPEDTLFAVRVQREPTFAVLSREALFARSYFQNGWDLHPDGDRFAVPRSTAVASDDDEEGAAEPERYLIVTNWFTELRAALGGGN